MGKAIRLRGECQKNIVKLLDGLCGRYSRWEVWQDFIIMSAISIANVLGGPHKEAREREYMNHASRYSSKELEVFAQMLAEVAMEMEREPDQDLLGELFMALGLSNEWKGQFFTPYSVCRAMSGMTYGDDPRGLPGRVLGMGREKPLFPGFLQDGAPGAGRGAGLATRAAPERP